MCDGCRPQPDPMFQPTLPLDPWDPWDAPSPAKEDVRATKPHEVALRIVVEAEDARKATERVLSSYDGTGIEVLYVSASRQETEEYRW